MSAPANAAPEPDAGTITTYAAFWPYYLGEHRQKLTRSIHLAGTGAALILLVFIVMFGAWIWLPVMLVAGYGPAWASHYLVEKNRPATFRFPLWSLRSDLRMFFLWLRGRLQPELARHGL